MALLPLPRQIPLLSQVSVCKKIGLGYVPAVAFMLTVGMLTLFWLGSSGLIDGRSERVLLVVVLLGMGVAAVASIAAMLTAFSVGERVRCVLVAAEAGARGDLDQHVDSRPHGDEVDRLAESFNEMTSELRRRLESERRAREEAQRADEAKSRFLSAMSHELRTPLTVLTGFTALLEESSEGHRSPREVRYLEQIRVTTEHLVSIVNECLDLARIEGGHTTIEPQLISLNSVLDTVFESVGPLADDRQHFFTIEAPSQPSHVVVDPIRLRQVLYNLLSNAVKFTPPGGTVILRATVEGRDLLLEVEDSGIGIPARLHDRVFKRFERLHEDRIRAPGAGLGLALTRELVELQGGTISFKSTPDIGSTFLVRLPGVVTSRLPAPGELAATSASLLPGAARVQEHGTSLRILVVDDEPLNTWLFADVLESAGHQLVIEHDALAGLDRARSEPFDVLLLDIRMPGMRGDQMCRQLREEGMRVPIIAVSANAMPTEVNEGMSAGFDAYLTKPITPAALREAIAEVVGRSYRRPGRLNANH